MFRSYSFRKNYRRVPFVSFVPVSVQLEEGQFFNHGIHDILGGVWAGTGRVGACLECFVVNGSSQSLIYTNIYSSLCISGVGEG